MPWMRIRMLVMKTVSLDTCDPQFGDIILDLLAINVPDNYDSSESVVDDSDQDPDFLLPGREGQDILNDSSNEGDEVLLEGDACLKQLHRPYIFIYFLFFYCTYS